MSEEELFALVRNYVPGAVIPFLNGAEEKWASELRRISVIFFNLVRPQDAKPNPLRSNPLRPTLTTTPTGFILPQSCVVFLVCLLDCRLSRSSSLW